MRSLIAPTEFCLAVATRLERANVPFKLVSTGKQAEITSSESLLKAVDQEHSSRVPPSWDLMEPRVLK